MKDAAARSRWGVFATTVAASRDCGRYIGQPTLISKATSYMQQSGR